MIIKRGLITVATIGVPLQSSNYKKALMGDEQITLVWEASSFTQLYLGDYVTYEGANFTLNQLPTVKKLSSKLWQYNAVFQSTKYELDKVIYMLVDNSGTATNSEFTLSGTADTFIDLLIVNLNRVAGEGTWSKGEVVPGTDYINLTFSNESCLSVLSRLADEFDTEYHVNNNVIHLKKISTSREVTLQYGSTLYDIERSSVDSSDVVTRLYPFGSTKNLSSNYRGGNSPLRLPASAGDCLENNDNLYGVIERSKTFEDIYPRLSSGGAGTVTAVGNEFTFTDSALDFNINDYLLDGTTAKVHFNTGQCAGYDFEIKSYNNSTKTFILIANTQENDFTLPTADLKPAIGDKYVLIDIIMPPYYLDAAEEELLTKAQEYLEENSTPKVTYRVTFSSLYAKANLQNVGCGDTVIISDNDLGIFEQIRITNIQKGIGEWWNIQLDLANTVSKTTLQRITGDVSALQNNVLTTNERINRNNLRAYQQTKELQSMVFDPDGYFDPDNIRPNSIETNMLTVGAKSQSFQLSCLLQPNYAANPQVLQWSAGLLTHFTILDNAIKEWTVAQGSITITGGVQTSALYIYARCLRAGTTGDIFLSPSATKFDADATYYFFLLGVLHSPINSVRGISLTYGMTTINGQHIKTGVISSIDGGTYFNLNTGEIGGNIKFKSGSQYVDVAQGINDAVNNIEVGGRNLVRGSAFLDLSQFTYIGANVSIDATNKINGLNSVKSIQSGLSDYNFRGLSSKISAKTGDTFALTIYSFTDNISSFDEFASCDVLCFDGNGTRVFPNGITIDIKPTVNNVWQKNTSIFTITATNVVEIWVQPYVAKNGRLWFGGIKLERGNKATDWTPAPEDVQAEIQATNNFVNSVTAGLQSQIDGNITSWFYAYVPTIANVPASNWSTDTLRNNHLGDLFYDTTTGKAYRFQLVAGVYSWAMITDTDITKALADAQNAKDTADGKRRVFVAQPTTPYDIGDLWVQGTAGDIMRCQTAKTAAQSYAAGDWIKASKYTDDSAVTNFITNTYASDKSTIQTQIDGKIETYFQTSDPNTWAVGDRAGHNGDMWYNSTTNLLKRYNGTNNIWELIQDQKAIDAYATASTAKDTADGKRRVFVAQPTTPYDVGDLWVQGTAGDIMRCSVARATGAYTASDWVKASKYTDDTAANAAQATANAAQSAANTANGKLAEIADDNKLTPGEKQIAKKEWDIIVSEKDMICNYAYTYGQSYDSYIDAFDNLNAYITPLLANLNTTETNFSGADFRDAFKWYYNERQLVYNSVAAATKTYTDGKIASLYIGGENIIIGSKRTLTAGTNNWKYSVLHGHEALKAAATLASIAADTTITPAEKSTVKAEWDQIQFEKTKIDARADSSKTDKTAYGTAYINLFNYITPILANMTTSSTVNPTTFNATFASYYAARQSLLVAAGAYLKNSTTYTFSVGSITKSAGPATGISLFLWDFYNNAQAGGVVLNISASRQFYTFTVPASGYFSLLIYAGINTQTADNVVTFDQLMLQEGNKASAFTPAVRHVTDALQGSTDITGGLLATNLLMMKDLDGNIRAGMSGLTDNIGMWAGGTYPEALADIAKIILKKDGAGQLAGGKINWDAAGAMNVGLFNIFSNLLSSGNISFTSEALENLASIGGSTTNIASPGSTSAASYNSHTASLSSAQFTLTKNSLVKFRVPRSLTIVASDYATCNIYVKNSANSTVYASNRDKSATGNSSDNYDYAVNLQAGTYYVVVEIELNGTNSGNSQTVSITGYNGVGSTISIEPISTLTKIANNGMYSYWGASAYMFIRTDYGFEVRFGNYGLQVTTAGLKKMTDGVNWVTL